MLIVMNFTIIVTTILLLLIIILFFCPGGGGGGFLSNGSISLEQHELQHSLKHPRQHGLRLLDRSKYMPVTKENMGRHKSLLFSAGIAPTP